MAAAKCQNRAAIRRGEFDCLKFESFGLETQKNYGKEIKRRNNLNVNKWLGIPFDGILLQQKSELFHEEN